MPETRDTILKAVKEAFKRHKPKPIEFAISEDDMKEENGVWHIPVTPITFPVSMYDLYDDFAEIEVALEDEQKVKVFFFPALG